MRFLWRFFHFSFLSLEGGKKGKKGVWWAILAMTKRARIYFCLELDGFVVEGKKCEVSQKIIK